MCVVGCAVLAVLLRDELDDEVDIGGGYAVVDDVGDELLVVAECA